MFFESLFLSEKYILLTTFIDTVWSHFLSLYIPALLMTISKPFKSLTTFLNTATKI